MWIESHTELLSHPKFRKLLALTKWSETDALGKLHKLWYWAACYAQDGDLRPFGMRVVNDILLLPARSRVAIACKFVDSRPYLRIHDWWDYFGRFLQVKYSKRPEIWLEIKVKCLQGTPLENRTVNRMVDRTVTSSTLPTNQTLTTKEMETAENGGCSPPAPLAGAAAHPKACACEVCWKELMQPFGKGMK